MAGARDALRQYLEHFGTQEPEGPEVGSRAELLAHARRRLTPQQERAKMLMDVINAGASPEEMTPLTGEQLKHHRPLKRVDTLTGEEGEIA